MRFFTNIKVYACLLISAATFVSCSDDDESPRDNAGIYEEVGAFGEGGTESPGQWGRVFRMSIDNQDRLYFGDEYFSSIKSFNVDGSFNGITAIWQTRVPQFLNDTQVTYGAGLYANSQLLVESRFSIIDVAPSAEDNSLFFISDDGNANGYNHYRINRYDMTSGQLLSWGEQGDANNQTNELWGISVSRDYVVVTGRTKSVAQVFTKKGVFVRAIDFSDYASGAYDNFIKDDFLYIAAASTIIKINLKGKLIEPFALNYLEFATDVVVDSHNNIIVSDLNGKKKVHVFRRTGDKLKDPVQL